MREKDKGERLETEESERQTNKGGRRKDNHTDNTKTRYADK